MPFEYWLALSIAKSRRARHSARVQTDMQGESVHISVLSTVRMIYFLRGRNLLTHPTSTWHFALLLACRIRHSSGVANSDVPVISMSQMSDASHSWDHVRMVDSDMEPAVSVRHHRSISHEPGIFRSTSFFFLFLLLSHPPSPISSRRILRNLWSKLTVY